MSAIRGNHVCLSSHRVPLSSWHLAHSWGRIVMFCCGLYSDKQKGGFLMRKPHDSESVNCPLAQHSDLAYLTFKELPVMPWGINQCIFSCTKSIGIPLKWTWWSLEKIHSTWHIHTPQLFWISLCRSPFRLEGKGSDKYIRQLSFELNKSQLDIK